MGKRKYIETPEKLWELFEMYKDSLKQNPRIKIEYVGKNGDKVETPIQRPLVMEHFECFVMDHTKITYPDLSEYFECKNETYKDYFPISMRIRKEIRADQTEGGLLGFYNSSLTARIQGYKEQTENNTTNTIQVLNIDPLDDSTDNKS